MRYALAAVIFTTAVTSAAAQSVPKLKPFTPYSDARVSLLALGWKPAPVPTAEQFCTGGREDVCSRYPETLSCSGTGRAFCSFAWRQGQRLIEVTTQGEEVDRINIAKVTCRVGC